jgi:hypothetical protein
VIRRPLRPGGRLVFETRDPDRYSWQQWDRAHTYATKAVPGFGTVATWHEVTHVRGDLVTYRSSYAFESDGTVLTSDSTLRFRDRRAVEESLEDAGFTVTEVREAPDRPAASSSSSPCARPITTAISNKPCAGLCVGVAHGLVLTPIMGW